MSEPKDTSEERAEALFDAIRALDDNGEDIPHPSYFEAREIALDELVRLCRCEHDARLLKRRMKRRKARRRARGNRWADRLRKLEELKRGEENT